ncbi:MAG: hypothetical protein KDD62_06145 [Bdellovibrionales bacterium]|nr:hypothetical protein [Bdellovibrionales bacterium]
MSEFSLHIEDLDDASDQLKDTVAKILEYGFDLSHDAISQILNEGAGLIAEASSRAELEARCNKLLAEGANVKIVQAAQGEQSSLDAIKGLGNVDFDPNDSLYSSTFSEEEQKPSFANVVAPAAEVEPLAFDFDSDDDSNAVDSEPSVDHDLTIKPEEEIVAKPQSDDDDFDLDISFDDNLARVEETRPPLAEDHTDDFVSNLSATEPSDDEANDDFEESFDLGSDSLSSDDEETLVADVSDLESEDPVEHAASDLSFDMGFDEDDDDEEEIASEVSSPAIELQPQPTSDLSMFEEALDDEEVTPEAKPAVHPSLKNRKPVELHPLVMGQLPTKAVEVDTFDEEDEEEQVDEDFEATDALDDELTSPLGASGKRRRKKKGNNKLASIILCAAAIGSALYFFTGKTNDYENTMALKQEKMLQQKKQKHTQQQKAVEKKAKAENVPVNNLRQEFLVSEKIGEVEVEGSILYIEGKVQEVEFTISTPEPRKLTPEELVEYKKENPWMQRVVIESPGIVQSPDGLFTAAGRARIYVDDNGERSRVLESVTLKGTVKEGLTAIPLEISMGKKPSGVETNYFIKRIGELSYQTWFSVKPTLHLKQAEENLVVENPDGAEPGDAAEES